MDIIKKHLENISSDENQMKDFLEANENEIKSFFTDLWERQTAKPAEENSQIETEEVLQTDEVSAQAVSDAQEILTEAQKEMKFSTDNPLDKEQTKQEALQFQIKNKQITFTNGKVNQPYEIEFDFEKLEIPEIAEVSFGNLEDIELQYFPDEKKIKGTPTKAGDHKITMYFKRKDWEEGKPLLSREVVFIINPDPRELWSKSTSTPKDIEYYKPDSDKLFVKVKSKITKRILGIGKKEIPCKDMVAASKRGRSHAIEGNPRDDDFALYFDEETEWYVMVVADGAGSAKYSRKGSQIACQTTMEVCKAKLLDNKAKFLKNKNSENRNEIGKILQEIIGNAVFESYKAIEKEAQTKNALVKNYATTLLMVLCKKFEYGWIIASWWVGDGGIGIYSIDPPDLKIMGEPDGGEFAGQTRFLTMPEIIKNDLYKRMRFEVVEDFTALILMTDGVTDPKFETDANLNKIEKWNELWEDLNGKNEDGVKVDFSDDSEQSAEQLLTWLDFWSKGNHDDRTIAILF